MAEALITVVTFVTGILVGVVTHERFIHPTLARRARIRRRLLS
jgi:hypothetical protein